MTTHKYPPLKRDQIIAILKVWGFTLDRQESSHEQWEGVTHDQRRLVTLDLYDEFAREILLLVIRQSGLSRDEFYCATKQTAKKINKKYVKPIIEENKEEESN